MADKPLNIYQRINEVRKKAPHIKKDASVQGYKAVTHDAVTALLHKHLVEFGIVTRQTLSETKLLEAGTTKNGTIQRMLDNQYDVDFINIDNPDDRMTVRVQAQAIDTGDKAPGKAMSYAMKYALLKTFNIETGDNEESRSEMFERKEQQRSLVDNEQIEALKRLIAKSESNIDDLLGFYKKESLEAMNQAQRADLQQKLHQKIKKQEQK
jgi:hypothetical protein